MKIISIVFLLATFYGCMPDKLEFPKAKSVVEDLIMKIDHQDYKAISALYTPQFNASEPDSERVKKLQTLRDLLGEVKSFELIDSLNENITGEESKITLTYRINRTKANSLETFNVMYEEGGYRVSGHSVKSGN